MFPTPAQAATSSIFTISVWVNPTTSVSSKALVAKAEELRVFTDPSGFVGCQIKATAWQTAAQSTTNALTLSTWSHVACAYDKANLTVYVNGIQVAQTALSAAADDTANALKVGQDDSAATPYTNLSGTIDEFKFYNFALTAGEVKLDMNRGASQIFGALSQGTGSADPGTAASQEYCVPGDSTTCSPPMGRWDFEEGSGTTVNDLSGNANSGTITGATYTAGKIGKGLNFNGGTDQVGSIPSIATVKTVEFWVNPTSSTASFMDINVTTPAYVSSSAGTVSATGFTSPTIYVNGVSGGTLTTNAWNHVAVITNTALTGSAIKIGRANGTSLTGKMDGVRIFDYPRSTAQVAWDYNRGAPVGHWKMDECQGTTINDSSGNSLAGTLTVGATGTQTTAGNCVTANTAAAWYNGRVGKRNASLNFDGTDDYVAVGNTGKTVNSVSFWIKPSSTTQNILDLNGTQTVTLSAGTLSANGFTSPTYYVDGIATSRIADTNWHHVVVTTATGFSAGAMDIGRVATNYFTGQIDDVRIYNYALTAKQVQELYNGGAARFAPATGPP